MDSKNEVRAQEQSKAKPQETEVISLRRKSFWERFLQLGRATKTVLVFVFIIVLVVLNNLFDLRTKVIGLYKETIAEKTCKALVNTAREYAAKDDFDQSLRILDETKIPEGCKQNRDIDVLRDEVKLFRTVNQLSQFRLKEDNGKVKDLEAGLKILKDQGTESQSAEFYTLFGILEELHDWPSRAPDWFRRARGHAQASNAWGLMILRWRIGDSDWANQALAKFDEATLLKNDYAWPRANKAAVFLELAQDEVNKNQPYNVETPKGEPNLGLAQTYLDKARDSLELAAAILKIEGHKPGGEDKSLQDHPRLHMLWAQYDMIQGQVYRPQKGRGLDAERSFLEAINHLQTAKRVDSSIAEASLNLGEVYEELGMFECQVDDTKALELQEFRNAVFTDKDNLQARMKLGFALFTGKKDRKTRDEAFSQVSYGLELIGRLRQEFLTRRGNTGDRYATTWLNKRLQEMDIWEDNFREMEKQLKVRQ